MVNKKINDGVARSELKRIIEVEVNDLKITQAQRRALKKVGEVGAARSSEYKNFGLTSGQDFSSNFLVRLHQLRLLTQKQKGKIVSYFRRGTAALDAKYGLFKYKENESA